MALQKRYESFWSSTGAVRPPPKGAQKKILVQRKERIRNLRGKRKRGKQ